MRSSADDSFSARFEIKVLGGDWQRHHLATLEQLWARVSRRQNRESSVPK
jgi:hypothetical protein